ncbi:NitT/TauT family transport system permease protein [Actinoplanes lutulentus]|uniref:NitT/TauT family transport system permease protein n=1 Tax=Actinoplanes lutulentus TaxID=1287878 RepID=A0A327Z6L7_9ACTN|nr:ABC transporter permease [Actinoplanes lutulentus]MBB2946138.1 NitT/TauT family transport system permease protein [Actinoplanes lutulentus]RAK32828.1 NitT/TauT family transport system permease protein [Actinoplanes lutulentus]
MPAEPTKTTATRAAIQGLDPGAFPPPADLKPVDLAAADRVSGLDALELGPKKEKGRLGLRIWNSTWPKLLAIAIVIAIWQVTVLSEWKPIYVLPAPLDVFTVLKDLITTADFWNGVRLTMTRAITGFFLAVLIGTIIGAAVSRFAPLRAAIGSLITGLQTMPSIMWFPLAILLFQLGESAIMFVVVLGAAPSVANGLISGIDYVPRTWLRVGQVMGMKGFAQYRHLILPASLPSFVSGLKQGWAFSWRSLMAGELLVIVPGTVSVGVRMQNARDLSDSALVISYIIVVLVIGILIDQLFNFADGKLRKRWGLTEP